MGLSMMSSGEEFEGILEVLKQPSLGFKDFCGARIELAFQHAAETQFYFTTNFEEVSINNSEYLNNSE